MSRAFVPASVEGAMLKEYKPVFTVGTIDEVKDRSNASEGEKHKAVLRADLDTEVTRLEECLRNVKRQREEARTIKANTKPVKSSKIIKQVLDWMIDSIVILTHYKLFTIALELECQYTAKLIRTTQMCDKMPNKARSGPVKAEEEEMSEEVRTNSTSVAYKDNKAQSSLAAELRMSGLYGKVVDYIRLNNENQSSLARILSTSRLYRRTLEAVRSEQCTLVSNNKAGSVPVRLVTTNLRLANVGSITIEGVIPRLKVSVGRILIVMPVHVVKDTMFNIIIRRLFFMLTKCETKDFKNSNQILTLTDLADQNQKCQVET
ncbi:uncharacterized protein FOMMEDRAFT_23314 [Fomitiporia mediterranea MF3/22]|uniref:uncharacterized protein n=1 Tax=Fomitiporia mediterranea (strain MF3/22) TaxID=694068 RepID=UPI00044078DA|nr:uncharacterized protein FOMMEDRAFT_23314 [Fomitiporia mediterranea MF3/22]EJC98932.1 hypothetical protein FOMMEDRAFT_23314 [Fomitiporia mediterranea MF3/22]